MIKNLLPLIPPHKCFVEAYGGSASLLINKEPSSIEVYNDLNDGLISLFRIVKDDEKVKQFVRNITLTLYSRKEFEDAKYWKSANDEFTKAEQFYIRHRLSFGGIGSSFATSKNTSRHNISAQVSRYLTTIPLIWEIHNRFKTVIIENLSALELIDLYDGTDTFFYLDPPYVHSERTMSKVYDYEIQDNDHKELVQKLLKIKGKVLLSGYDNTHYEYLEQSGWNTKLFNSRCNLQEKVWFNYDLCCN